MSGFINGEVIEATPLFGAVSKEPIVLTTVQTEGSTAELKATYFGVYLGTLDAMLDGGSVLMDWRE